MKSLLLLGRQKDIALAELESLYGNENFDMISEDIVGSIIDAKDIDFNRLGGSIKLAKILSTLPFSDWIQVERYMEENIISITGSPHEGKLQLGFSTFGFNIRTDQLKKLSLNAKRKLRNIEQSVRMIPNQSLQLNSAQILHNKLTGPRGMEIILIRTREGCIIGQTVQEQNIDAYSQRDYNRPFRDARVGMLPPKLAQILINLANPKENSTILDPFCGTGVLLQEALLDGFKAYGTDIEPRMIEYSKGNLDWLKGIYQIKSDSVVDIGDALDYEWDNFDAVACETYLGQAYSTYPDSQRLKTNIQNCDTIIKKFLRNIHDQLPIHGKMVLALPAWEDRINRNFITLPLLDQLYDLGYNQLSFSIINNNNLFYHRQGQIVARQIIVLTRN